MVPIKILLSILGSFFNIQAGLIAADKTTVTINPIEHTIEIHQQDLFGFVKTNEEKELIIARWNEFQNWEEQDISWVELLNNFSDKAFFIQEIDRNIEVKIQLEFQTEKDLEALGIWYNDELKKFSINNKTDDNIVAPKGTIKGKYIYFESDSTFSFSLTPFSNLPADFQNQKIPLEQIIEK